MGKKTGGKGPRTKGNRYELDIAKRLNKVVCSVLGLSEGGPPLFSRTPRSGGWRRDVPVGLENQVIGDLVTPIWWPWAVECKDHKTWAIPAWIKQMEGAIKESRSIKDWILVVHKYRSSDDYVVMHLDSFLHLVSLSLDRVVADEKD